MPFAIFRKLNDATAIVDGEIERLDAMRKVLGDAFNKGAPLPNEALVSPPGHVAQAVGIAYAAEIIANPVLRETVQSTIQTYLEIRPLQAAPRQLLALERLIRECANAPAEEITKLCESFTRTSMTSGSVFRGAPERPRRETLHLRPKTPPKKGPKKA